MGGRRFCTFYYYVTYYVFHLFQIHNRQSPPSFQCFSHRHRTKPTVVGSKSALIAHANAVSRRLFFACRSSRNGLSNGSPANLPYQLRLYSCLKSNRHRCVWPACLAIRQSLNAAVPPSLYVRRFRLVTALQTEYHALCLRTIKKIIRFVPVCTKVVGNLIWYFDKTVRCVKRVIIPQINCFHCNSAISVFL